MALINPVAAELQNMSPEAKSAALLAHQTAVQGMMANARQPANVESTPSPVAAVSSARSLAAPSAASPPAAIGMPPPEGLPNANVVSPTMPTIKSPTPTVHGLATGTVEGDQALYNQWVKEGPGVGQIYSRIANSRFGQAHPIPARILGGVTQGLATGLEAAGSMFGPTAIAEQYIPGTTAYHAERQQELARNIGMEEKQRTDAATQAREQAQADLARAQTQNLEPWQQRANEELAPHGMRLDANNKIENIPYNELSETQKAQVDLTRNPYLKEPGNQPLADRVPQLNQAMTRRYQLLHPGEALPAEYTLPANAVKNDFDRVDKLMNSEETAAATQETRKQSEADRQESLQLRQAMLALAQQNVGDKGAVTLFMPDGKGGYTATRVKPGDTVGPGGMTAPQMGGANAKDLAATTAAGKALNYANTYLASKQYTGPSDEALQDQFFELAKPSTGFKMTQTQIDQLHNMQSWMNSAAGEAYHIANGTWFSPEQRQQIVQTMNMIGQAKGIKPAAAQGGAQQPLGKTKKPDGFFDQDGKHYEVKGGLVYAR